MKRLVICCDGTWNKAEQVDAAGNPNPTNVTRVAYRTAKRDTTNNPQIVFYDEGVGTGNFFDRITGGGTGEGLDKNIFEAYRFLVANYEPDDEIYLFGFSRGAFTARSIAGMIRNSGILQRTKILKYRQALELYLARGKHPDDKLASNFRRDNAVLERTPIKFIGVWDTVGALGIPTKAFGLNKITRSQYEFHDTELSASVEHAYHALAIDEHRRQFTPTLWGNPPKPLMIDPARNQTIEQVWFSGAHSDVGGGYEAWGTTCLSDIPLHWILSKAASAGLALDQDVLTTYPVTNDCCATLHDSHGGIKWGLPINRKIGITTTEYVHRSVLDRWEQQPAYRPTTLQALNNLTNWLNTNPRPDTIRTS